MKLYLNFSTLLNVLKSLVPTFFFFFGCIALGILVFPPAIEPGLSTMKAWSRNYWTAREFWPVTLKAISE